jgi:hypothetical protein
MNPDELASLVDEQKQQESEAERLRKEKKQAKKKRAEGAPRYVTLEEKEDGLQLTIRGIGKRFVYGVLLLLGALFFLFMVGAWSGMYVFAALTFAMGLFFLITRRTTYRILTTPKHFAIFEGTSTKPIQVGELEELKVYELTSKGTRFCMISVSKKLTMWVVSLEGISHPDDLADIARFGKQTGTSLY